MPKTNSLHISIVDDQPCFRQGLSMLLLLLGKNCISTIDEYTLGKEFLHSIKEKSPDIVFMDYDMPELDGVETTVEALKVNPNLIIIGMSLYEDTEYIESMINSGARGYLFKSSDNTKILESIIKDPSSGYFFSHPIIQKLNLYEKIWK